VSQNEPTIEWLEVSGQVHLVLGGDWTNASLNKIGWSLRVPPGLAERTVIVKFRQVNTVDSNAALSLRSWFGRIAEQCASLTLEEPPTHFITISTLLDEPVEDLEPLRRRPVSDGLVRLGKAVVDLGRIGGDLIAFMGQVTISLVMTVLLPTRMRGKAVVHHMTQAGVAALPIVGLLSFLIGVVTAYQGADQLARFGAEIFTVNVVGIGVLREMGALITAIVVAGRSASAFAAQIGTMKINEEVDALRVIGIDPMVVLVVPRMLALMVIFPFLVVWADILGVFGGAIMATVALDISFSQFITQFQSEVPLTAFWIGLSKAPLFAAAIAGIGCYQGLQVGQGAAAVGEKTTAAVVQAIFLVIVIDALMSIVYSVIGI
jgi:phospholipid/cholesterol/gamma-HCH transport system permease protein